MSLIPPFFLVDSPDPPIFGDKASRLSAEALLLGLRLRCGMSRQKEIEGITIQWLGGRGSELVLISSYFILFHIAIYSLFSMSQLELQVEFPNRDPKDTLDFQFSNTWNSQMSRSSQIQNTTVPQLCLLLCLIFIDILLSHI